MPRPRFILALLLTGCFTLATSMQLRVEGWRTDRTQSDDPLQIMLGDARRLFANHFFAKADIYFHSGYYPSIFDQAAKEEHPSRHMTEEHDDDDHDHQDTHSGSTEPAHHDHGHEEHGGDFLGQPRDWIDRFGRNFYSSTHTHLDKPGQAREILPWLKLAAEMDPQEIETYTVASFWLRKRLDKPDEAEKFLREGWRANPKSYEILYELGEVYSENRHDYARARNVWELGLRYWQERDATNQVSVIQRLKETQNVSDLQPDVFVYEELVANLAHLETEQGNYPQALHYLALELDISPVPEEIQKQINELKQKMNSKASAK